MKSSGYQRKINDLKKVSKFLHRIKLNPIEYNNTDIDNSIKILKKSKIHINFYLK